MGYFSTSAQLLAYHEQWCDRCYFGEGCPMWFMQVAYNHEAENDEEHWLHKLIPCGSLGNLGCRLYMRTALGKN